MPTRKKRRERQLDWRTAIGHRFWPESVNSAIDRKMVHNLIHANFVSLSIPAPCSHLDILKKIAAGAHKPIPVDYLCSELGDKMFARAIIVFGSPGKYFDQIAQNYPDLYWWLSDKGLRMEVLPGNGSLPSFDELAGRLVDRARSTSMRKNLKQSDYEAIAQEIDKAGFKLREHLQRRYRIVLTEWNRQHPRRTITTFCGAIQAKQPHDLKRGVRRCFYYAAEKFKTRAS